MTTFPLLSLLVFVPILAGLALFFVRSVPLARLVAVAVAALEFFLALALWAQLPLEQTVAFVERASWMPSLGVEYFLGLDGIGLLFVLLTTLVFPMAYLVSWNSQTTPAYWAMFLLLQGGLLGTFTALNFIHWFFFWELSLIPAFFLVRMAGGPHRAAAATQFFVYTMIGSLAMLAGFLGLYFAAGTFDFIELAALRADGRQAAGLADLTWFGASPSTISALLFFLVFAGLAVKLPLVPFHGWLAPAYTQAAPAVTMILTGVMSKMGVYGLVRVLLPIFPDQIQAFQGLLMCLAVGTIIYSAFAALAQTELKHLLAYSSINHLGYCALGVFAAGRIAPDASFGQSAALNGVLLQVFSHGLLAAGLFAFAEFLARRNHGILNLDSFGGLRAIAPAAAGLMGIAMFASLGLPGLSGFVAEFLIFQGAFALNPWAAALSVLGLLLTAVFLLGALQKIFTGPLSPHLAGVRDLGSIETAAVAPALVLSFLVGIYPALLGVFINPAVIRIVEQLQP